MSFPVIRTKWFDVKIVVSEFVVFFFIAKGKIERDNLITILSYCISDESDCYSNTLIKTDTCESNNYLDLAREVT